MDVHGIRKSNTLDDCNKNSQHNMMKDNVLVNKMKSNHAFVESQALSIRTFLHKTIRKIHNTLENPMPDIKEC